MNWKVTVAIRPTRRVVFGLRTRVRSYEWVVADRIEAMTIAARERAHKGKNRGVSVVATEQPPTDGFAETAASKKPIPVNQQRQQKQHAKSAASRERRWAKQARNG